MKANTIKMFLTAVLALAFISVANTASAEGKDGNDTAKKASVTYLGTVNSQPIFQVNIENESADDITISLENTDGDVLYKKNTLDTKFTQKIQLQTTDTNIELNLIVYSKKTKKSQVYYINKMTKVVDDMAVTEVKY